MYINSGMDYWNGGMHGTARIVDSVASKFFILYIF